MKNRRCLFALLLLAIPSFALGDAVVCTSGGVTVVDGHVFASLNCTSIPSEPAINSFMNGLSNNFSGNAPSWGYGTPSTGSSASSYSSPNSYYSPQSTANSYTYNYGDSGSPSSTSSSFSSSLYSATDSMTQSNLSQQIWAEYDAKIQADLKAVTNQGSSLTAELAGMAMAFHVMQATFQPKVIEGYKQSVNNLNASIASQQVEFDSKIKEQNNNLRKQTAEFKALAKTININKGIDREGLVQKKYLASAHAVKAHSMMASAIRSSSTTDFGVDSRDITNTALLRLNSNSTVEQEAVVAGTLSLVAGAEMATAEDSLAGDVLLGYATATDLALSLAPYPFVGSANDLTQIVFGMATGFDYTGHKMKAGDFALRGAGVVLGIAPFGHQAAKIGLHWVDRAFSLGAQVARHAGLAPALERAQQRAFILAARVAGRWVTAGKESIQNPKLYSRLIEHLAASGTVGGLAEQLRLARVLLKEDLVLERRVSIIESFTPGTLKSITLRRGETIYRWHDNSQDIVRFGHYFSLKAESGAMAARESLAIPYSNKMTMQESYVALKDMEVFVGEVAPFAGLKGGGEQLYIVDKTETLLKNTGRVNP